MNLNQRHFFLPKFIRLHHSTFCGKVMLTSIFSCSVLIHPPSVFLFFPQSVKTWEVLLWVLILQSLHMCIHARSTLMTIPLMHNNCLRILIKINKHKIWLKHYCISLSHPPLLPLHQLYRWCWLLSVTMPLIFWFYSFCHATEIQNFCDIL